MASFDVPAKGPENFHFETKSAGKYKVQVTPFEEKEGRYSIQLSESRTSCHRPEKRVSQLMTLIPEIRFRAQQYY